MNIVGIDLAGPSNLRDTHLTAWRVVDGRLLQQCSLFGLNDLHIAALVSELTAQTATVVGLDAPLSYNLGGGDRPADAALRRRIVAVGMRSGSVMTPTMMRMVYLTLRGVALARTLMSLQCTFPIRIVEVHPGATLGLGGAPPAAVLSFKRDPVARLELLEWLRTQGLEGNPTAAALLDHEVAAWAAALAAWRWYNGDSVWCYPAQPPHHPFDFAC